MKKVLLMAAFAVATLTANAQFYVGGSVSFNSEKAGKDADAVTSFKLAPEFGYALSENFAVGAEISFSSSNGEDNAFGIKDPMTGELAKVKGDKSYSTFRVAPYARYTFYKTGIASFFVDGGVGFNFFNEDRGMVIGIGVRPGVKIAASEKVDLVAKLGYLGYQFANEKAGEGSKFGLGIDNTNISFGVFYNF